MNRLVSVVMLMAAGVSVPCAGKADSHVPFDLVPPLQLEMTDIYLDGGTVFFRVKDSRDKSIIGGFDGRMCGGDRDMTRCGPWHLFLGAEYPDKPGARLLPLWGEEERQVVQLLAMVVRARLQPDHLNFLLDVQSAMDLPDSISVGLWHLVGRTIRRERVLDAIDRGLPDCEDCMQRRVDTSTPCAVSSIAFVDSTANYEVTMRDPEGIRFVLCLPTDSLTADPAPTSMSYRGEKTYLYHTDAGPVANRPFIVVKHALGSLEDRCWLTTLMVSLPRCAREIRGAELIDPLMRMVRWRAKKTLETDSSR